MIWTVLADTGLLLVESNFSDGVFKQEHPTLRVRSRDNREVIFLVDNETVAGYKPDENKMVYIDLTDYFSTIPIGTGVTNELKVSTPIGGAVVINYDIKGLRNPQYMEIPNALQESPLYYCVSIVPPSKWLNPLFGLNDKVEVYRFADVMPSGANSLLLVYPTRTSIVPIVLSAQELNSIEIPSDILTNSVALQLLRDNYTIDKKKYSRQPLICGRRYAAVEWQSRTGMIKRHTWEVRDVKDSAYEQVELAARFNSYRENKGYEEIIVLHLDGLTRYDYWYYCDIITSSDVRVALNEVDADFGEDARVQVLTKSAEHPNANGLYELNVEIKYKRYGRV